MKTNQQPQGVEYIVQAKKFTGNILAALPGKKRLRPWNACLNCQDGFAVDPRRENECDDLWGFGKQIWQVLWRTVYFYLASHFVCDTVWRQVY